MFTGQTACFSVAQHMPHEHLKLYQYQNDVFLPRKVMVGNITSVISKSLQMSCSVFECIWSHCYNEESWGNLGSLFIVRRARSGSLEQWSSVGTSFSARSAFWPLLAKKHDSYMSGWGLKPPGQDLIRGQRQAAPSAQWWASSWTILWPLILLVVIPPTGWRHWCPVALPQEHMALCKCPAPRARQGKVRAGVLSPPQGKPKVLSPLTGMMAQVPEFSSLQKLDVRFFQLTPSHSHHTDSGAFLFTLQRVYIGEKRPFIPPLKYNHYSYFGVFSSIFFLCSFGFFFWHSHDHTVYTMFYPAFST